MHVFCLLIKLVQTFIFWYRLFFAGESSQAIKGLNKERAMKREFYSLTCAIVTPLLVVQAFAGSEKDINWLRDVRPEGAALAYQYGGSSYNSESDIYLVEIATNSRTKVGRGSQPEFSPDGSKLAWIEGSTAKGIERKKTGTTHVIATGVDKKAGVHWVSNTVVVVVISSKWYRVHIGTGSKTEQPKLTALGTGGSEIDVKYRNGEWSYVTGTTWKISEGKSGSTNGHCSPSLSPDGKSVTGLQDGHDVCKLTSIISGGYSGSISRTLSDCSSKGIDNQRWSSNDKDFIVCQYECSNKIGVWQVGTSNCVILGNCTSESYGDFTKGSGAGDPWPDASVDPEMLCDIQTVNVQYEIGATAPSVSPVKVYTQSGSLEGVTANESADWLNASASQTSGANVSIDLSVAVSGLAEQTYTEQVTVSSSNAGSITFAVKLVAESNVPPALELTSPVGGETYSIGDNLQITWTGNPDSLERLNIFVSVNSGDDWISILGNSSANMSDGKHTWQIPAQVLTTSMTSANCRIKLEDYNEGSGIVDESHSDFTIADPSALHLKFNCGGGSVPGWQDASQYASGGTNFDFGQTFSVAGVDGAAPAEIYETCRHRIKNVETGFSYTIPSIPNGTCLVTLHFGDGNNDRSIDVAMEGTAYVQDLNISSQAGGGFKALVISKEVTVSGDDGLTIAIDDNGSSPGDVLINGFEIMAESSPMRVSRLTPLTNTPFTVNMLSHGKVIISTQALQGTTLLITDLTGKTMLSWQPQSGYATRKISLAPGTYGVYARTGHSVTSRSITIQ